MQPDKSFLEKYPEKKPVCFNNTEARNLILALYEENASQKHDILEEISGFLQKSGFEDASKAVDCRYNL